MFQAYLSVNSNDTCTFWIEDITLLITYNQVQSQQSGVQLPQNIWNINTLQPSQYIFQLNQSNLCHTHYLFSTSLQAFDWTVSIWILTNNNLAAEDID